MLDLRIKMTFFCNYKMDQINTQSLTNKNKIINNVEAEPPNDDQEKKLLKRQKIKHTRLSKILNY